MADGFGLGGRTTGFFGITNPGRLSDDKVWEDVGTVGPLTPAGPSTLTPARVVVCFIGKRGRIRTGLDAAGNSNTGTTVGIERLTAGGTTDGPTFVDCVGNKREALAGPSTLPPAESVASFIGNALLMMCCFEVANLGLVTTAGIERFAACGTSGAFLFVTCVCKARGTSLTLGVDNELRGITVEKRAAGKAAVNDVRAVGIIADCLLGTPAGKRE